MEAEDNKNNDGKIIEKDIEKEMFQDNCLIYRNEENYDNDKYLLRWTRSYR
mgnify:CR=1 FL=1